MTTDNLETRSDALLEQILAELTIDAAYTASELARRVGERSHAGQMSVRNRLYWLERRGVAICDDERPQRWMRNELPPPCRILGCTEPAGHPGWPLYRHAGPGPCGHLDCADADGHIDRCRHDDAEAGIE